MASGNHEMYIRRRRPDTLEVTIPIEWKTGSDGWPISGAADEVPEEG